MTMYVKKTVHYVTSVEGDVEFRLVIEGNSIREARVVTPSDTMRFTSLRELVLVAKVIENVLRRFNDETKGKGIQET